MKSIHNSNLGTIKHAQIRPTVPRLYHVGNRTCICRYRRRSNRKG